MQEEAAMREKMKLCWHLEMGGRKGFILNPVVTGGAAAILITLIAVCMAAPDSALKGLNVVAFEWIPDVWTWLYIVSQDIWIVVLFYLMMVPKYANMKLGKDDEEPEYSFATWFSMLFSAGVAVGLFYYSVAEPVWHYTSGSARFRSSVKGYGNLDEDATHAIMVTWFHWGLHGWIPYTTMGAVLAIMSYRRGFPMTIRYCLWPILGEKCYGWMGDCVDILSIVTTIAGVCTSLGLGAMQINAGLQRMNHGAFRGQLLSVPNEAKYANPSCGGTGQKCGEGEEPYGIQQNATVQCIIIVIVTLCATASVVSGMNNGIVNLSRFNFALGMFLLLSVLFLGETWFVLDTLVQTTGYYIWYVVKIGFWTDAWERLGGKNLGRGGSPDGVGGGSGWLSGWTIFYWGWWISWGPFVGTFLAKISRGRTVRQFIMGTLIVPTVYSFIWFGVFGAEGIRMQRLAQGSGVCDTLGALSRSDCQGGETGIPGSTCQAYSAQFSSEFKKANNVGFEPSCQLKGDWGKCDQAMWTRHVEFGEHCRKKTSWVNLPCKSTGGAYSDPTAMPSGMDDGPCQGKYSADDFGKFPEQDAPDCFVPAPDGIVCLSSQGTEDIFFDQISSYGPRVFSDVLSVVAMVALVLYFVTSSDSGSLVVDIISANGHPNPPIPQRIAWSFVEGLTAIALLLAGSNSASSQGSLRALQSASLITGLPYTFILFWCSQALYLLIREETGDIKENRKPFSTFVLSLQDPKLLLKNCVIPGHGCGRIIKEIGGWPFHSMNPNLAFYLFFAMFQGFLLLVVVFLFACIDVSSYRVMAGAMYLGFTCFLGFLRTQFRVDKKILHGDMLTDQLVAMCMPMFAITQMEVQLERGENEWQATEKERASQEYSDQMPLEESTKRNQS